jgi:hypothetical protein
MPHVPNNLAAQRAAQCCSATPPLFPEPGWAPCGRETSTRIDLFSLLGVIHAAKAGLVAAQTQADYFRGAAWPESKHR